MTIAGDTKPRRPWFLRVAQLMWPIRRLPVPDPWNRLSGTDWTFIAFAWLTLSYFFYNVAELVNGNPEFDFLPVGAGFLIVPFGWWATRLRLRARQAIEALGDGAAFVQRGEGKLPAFLDDVARTVRRWQWIVAVAILAVIVGWLAFLLYKDGYFSMAAAAEQPPTKQQQQQQAPQQQEPQQQQQQAPPTRSRSLDISWGNAGLLVVVMVSVAAVVGSILGSLVGYGLLPRTMKRHGVELAGLSTGAARNAMRTLEGLFGFAVLATGVLCLWFGGWLLYWGLGFDVFEYRERWYEMYLGLWVIACAIHIAAGYFPATQFQRRLDELYGGAEARRAIDRQIAEATGDRAEVAAEVRAGKWRRRPELVDLDRFLAAQQERQFRSPLVNRGFVNAALAVSLAVGVAGLGFQFLGGETPAPEPPAPVQRPSAKG